MSRPTRTSFEDLFTTSPLGCALIDIGKGGFLQVNKAFADLIGHTISETLKLSYFSVTPDIYRDQMSLHQRSLEERWIHD